MLGASRNVGTTMDTPRWWPPLSPWFEEATGGRSKPLPQRSGSVGIDVFGACSRSPGASASGETAEWAERIVGWYEARWGIEEYFQVLKTGTRIEDRRLLEADALAKCLAFDAVTAWRVFSLDRYARDEPETPAAEVLTEDEREVIGIVVRGERLLPPAERGRPFPPNGIQAECCNTCGSSSRGRAPVPARGPPA